MEKPLAFPQTISSPLLSVQLAHHLPHGLQRVLTLRGISMNATVAQKLRGYPSPQETIAGKLTRVQPQSNLSWSGRDLAAMVDGDR
jgi:hypothetical protein